MKTGKIVTFLAILDAALYAINIPLSKVLLEFVQPTMMAAFLYLGAGVGLFFYGTLTKEKGEKLTKRELPYTFGMIVLDIAAPILLMLGLQHTHEHSHSHTHEHAHGDMIHSHAHTHTHSHTHIHGQDEATHSHTHNTLEGHDHCHIE